MRVKIDVSKCNVFFCLGIMVFGILSILAVVKSLLVGFDIDEAYAVAQSYRLVAGDKLFLDMWEPHQLSAFGSAIFIAPYVLLAGGTTGLVLYLRVVGTVIHLAIGYGFFGCAGKRFGWKIGIIIAMIHINFLSKWITLPEFEIMQYWATCVMFLSFLKWRESEKIKWLVIASLALWIALMTYPTMIILYPVYVVTIFKFSKNTREGWKAVLWFTLPVFFVGIGFLLYLASYMSVSEFAQNVSYVMMDESHPNILAHRMRNFWGEIKGFADQFVRYVPYVLFGTVAVGALQMVCQPKEKRKVDKGMLLIVFMLLYVGIFSLKHVVYVLRGETNQFYLYFRFLMVAVAGIVATLACRKRNMEYFWLGILPGFVGVVASVVITNMTFEISLARIYIAVMASCFVVAEWIKNSYEEDFVIRLVGLGVSAVFIIGLLMCKLWQVRVTGCLPANMTMDMALIEEGPAKGIFVSVELAEQYNENFPIIKSEVDENDRLLYFGSENLYYFAADAEWATPYTQGTSVFNEMYLKYFEEHPEKLPTVIVIDKSFGTNPVYYYSSQNSVVLEWIEKEYKDAEVLETTYLKILKKSK